MNTQIGDCPWWQSVGAGGPPAPRISSFAVSAHLGSQWELEIGEQRLQENCSEKHFPPRVTRVISYFPSVSNQNLKKKIDMHVGLIWLLLLALGHLSSPLSIFKSGAGAAVQQAKLPCAMPASSMRSFSTSDPDPANAVGKEDGPSAGFPASTRESWKKLVVPESTWPILIVAAIGRMNLEVEDLFVSPSLSLSCFDSNK